MLDLCYLVQTMTIEGRWKELLQQEADAMKRKEALSAVPLVYPRNFNRIDLIDCIGAKHMLNNIRMEVWGGVGEVKPIYGGYALTFSYPVAVLQADTVTTYYTTDSYDDRTGSAGDRGGSVSSSMSIHNLRTEIEQREKVLAIRIETDKYSYSYLRIHMERCISNVGSTWNGLRVSLGRRFEYGVVGDGILWTDDVAYYDMKNDAYIFHTDKLEKQFVEMLERAVLQCYSGNDLPLRLMERAVEKIAECKRNGGAQERYNWFPLKEKGSNRDNASESTRGTESGMELV